MNDKPRIGRPPNQDGHLYRTIGVSGTQHEIDAVLELTPRQRLEAMLDKIAAAAAADLWQPFIVTVQTRNGAQVTDARSVEITLSNGKRFDLRELTMFPGALNVSYQDGALSILPRSPNSVNIRSE